MTQSNEPTYFSKFAQRVHDNGFHVIPVCANSKHPDASAEWRGYCWTKPTDDRLKSWCESPKGHGLGLACGRASVAIDIDADDPDLVESICKIAVNIFGETPLARQGRTPRVALIYRPTEPVLSRHGRSIDTIGLGAQLVSYGIHPRSGAPYQWINGECPASVKASELPAISNEMIEFFYRSVAKNIFDCGEVKGQLAYDRINYTPPLSSISVMSNLLFRSVIWGPKNARDRAEEILIDKYSDTGTGLGVDMYRKNNGLDF